MVYLFIFLILIWLIYKYDYKQERRGYNLSFYVLLIIFIAVAGLRYRIGGDTVMYMGYYKKLHGLDALGGGDLTNSRFAPAYLFLTSLFKTFTPNFVYFQLFHSIIINTVVFYFIKRNCKNVFFCLFLFYFYLFAFLLFEQMRESFAVAIFLLAWPAFKNRVWWKWYIAAFCAFMFHISAFFMFILPAICLPGIRELFKFGQRTWIICFWLRAGAVLIQTTFFRYVQVIAVTESMLDRVQAYGSLERSSFNINRILGGLIQYIAYPLIALYFIYKNKNREPYLSQKNELDKVTSMALMSVYISIFTLFIGILIRYNNYFFFFAIIVMGDWIFSKIPVGRKLIRLGFLYWVLIFIPTLSYNFYFTYLTPSNKAETFYNYMRYYPYSSIIDQTIDPDREKTILYFRKRIG